MGRQTANAAPASPNKRVAGAVVDSLKSKSSWIRHDFALAKPYSRLMHAPSFEGTMSAARRP